MFIYIDESGVFANPEQKSPAVSCVAALVVPESIQPELFERFSELMPELTGNCEELKGGRLSETEIDRVLKFLGGFDVLAEISAIDLGIQREPEEIAEHQRGQAERFVRNITPETKPGMVRDLHSIRDRVLALPPNLYVQTVLMFELVDRVLRTSTLFFAQRIPRELGAFRWVIDAKGPIVTEYEELWGQIVLPALQFRSLEEPFIQLQEGDYSHFERFYKDFERPPPHLEKYLRERSEPFQALDVRKLLRESCSFADSRKEPGLQMVDIIASAFRRCIRGTLQQSGWRKLGRLLVKRKGGAVQLIVLKPSRERRVTVRVSYAQVIEHLNKTARSMWRSE